VDTIRYHDTPKVLDISFSNGIVLGATPGHPFLTTEGWKSRDPYTSKLEHNVDTTWLEIGD